MPSRAAAPGGLPRPCILGMVRGSSLFCSVSPFRFYTSARQRFEKHGICHAQEGGSLQVIGDLLVHVRLLAGGTGGVACLECRDHASGTGCLWPGAAPACQQGSRRNRQLTQVWLMQLPRQIVLQDVGQSS
jgi:hypothetical protein